ncbi:PqqD family protein [Parasphingorhabdus sp.]|uniref:PqqD family protein n=1 Tax=Parasphingorhabdus sp. TaxID=2709688 RepID=UPI003A93ED13
MKVPAHIRPTADVIATKCESEIFLLNVNGERYFSLKGVGKRFWEEISKNSSVEQAIGALIGEFVVSQDVLRKDITDLCEQLLARKLVEEMPSGG